MGIEGLRVVPLAVREDDRGSLFEAIHCYELPGFLGPGEGAPYRFIPGRFGQVYVVHNPVRGTVRAFHKHAVLWDYFAIIHGSAKFCFVDDRQNGVDMAGYERRPVPGWLTPENCRTNVPTPGEAQIVVTSARQPKLLVVPPGIFHGWVSLEDDTTLLSIASELYCRDKPDEVRVPPDYFNDEFGGDPWEVKGR